LRDFTLKIYYLLLEALKRKDYNFLSFGEYMTQQIEPTMRNFKSITSNNIKLGAELNNLGTLNNSLCILRHDVDRLPENSLATAHIEHSMDVKGSYYFRTVPGSFNIEIIKQIEGLGHEIGYHYEDVDLVLKSQKSEIKSQNGSIDIEKLIDLASESFCKNLEIFRKDFEIKTICMHGSPLSKYDNKLIWKKYDYKKHGIIGEPYFDINWNEFGYLTDTGRRWNGGDSSVRDKVESKFKFNFRNTKEIIENIDKLPGKVMFNIHPQRWNDKLVPWLKEYFSQNTKNVIKKYFFVNRK